MENFPDVLGKKGVYDEAKWSPQETQDVIYAVLKCVREWEEVF